MPWGRVLAIWSLIIVCESVSGTLRELLVVPAVGAASARQLGFAIGSVLIVLVSWLTAPWLHAADRRTQLAVGALWLALTALFEFVLGFARGFSLERIISDYDPGQGGLMALGLALLLFAPMLGASLRRMGD